MRFIYILFMCFPPFILSAQCDTSFYKFKRAIIETLSDNLKKDIRIKKSPNTIELEFSDYRRFHYSISDPKSTLGFVCRRDSACNSYSDSICIAKKSSNMYGFERTLFENFMSSDDPKICDSVNYQHTLARLIDYPLEGWTGLEKFYFRFYDNNDLNTYYEGKSVYLTIPVYVFLDKKLKQTMLYFIKVSGTQKRDIKLERRQTVRTK